jgi:hypothetical protein
MAKLFRLYITTIYIEFQIGVNIIGLPEFHFHPMVISKQINEIDAKKQGLL